MQALRRLPRLLPLSPKARVIAESVVYGLTAGLVAVAYQVTINHLYGATFPRFAAWGTGAFLIASFVLVVGTSLVAGALLSRLAPEAAGSGIPQLKLAYWKDFGFVPFRIAVVKFVAGALTVGGGSSLGREGPTVQIAGSTCSAVAGLMGKAKTGRRRAAASGAAAGLAAAFNTPLAAIAFVLEEILGDLNSPVLGSVVVASVLGALLVHAFLGRLPAFPLPSIDEPSWHAHALVPAAAILATLAGAWFQKAALGLRLACRAGFLRRIPAWGRPACGGIVTWAIGAAVFLAYGRLGIFGLGYDDLTLALHGQLVGSVVFVLLAGKLVATVVSYGSGGCGGIFAPCLFFGALCGCAVAQAARACGMALTPPDDLLLAIVAMSACLGSVVRAPLTSILIVFEMTQQFTIVPSLLVAGLISQALSRFLLKRNFYDQVLHDDGQVLEKVMPPRDFREWRERPVSLIANFRPVFAPDLAPAALQVAWHHVFYQRLIHLSPEGVPFLVIHDEADEAAVTGRPVPLHPVPVCPRNATIRQAQDLLVASRHGFVVLREDDHGPVIGLVTLHDLLRAQQNLRDSEETS